MALQGVNLFKDQTRAVIWILEAVERVMAAIRSRTFLFRLTKTHIVHVSEEIQVELCKLLATRGHL